MVTLSKANHCLVVLISLKKVKSDLLVFLFIPRQIENSKYFQAISGKSKSQSNVFLYPQTFISLGGLPAIQFRNRKTCTQRFIVKFTRRNALQNRPTPFFLTRVSKREKCNKHKAKEWKISVEYFWYRLEWEFAHWFCCLVKKLFVRRMLLLHRKVLNICEWWECVAKIKSTIQQMKRTK